MSNKGLTFLIIILLLLCAATFGVFYLKTNPQLAMSQKIFGSATVAKMNLANSGKMESPFNNNGIPVDTNNTSVDSATTNKPVITDGVSVTVEGGDNDTVVPNTGGVSTDTSTTTPEKPVTTVTGPITQTLKVGSRGTQVKLVQQFLIDNGYLKGKADGAYGNGTATAVKAFQTEYNLKADGIVTGETRTQINELLAAL